MAIIDKPSDYFNTVLYTGNNTARTITGLDFQPDWIWGKGRSEASDHTATDSVRGNTKVLTPNDSSGEGTTSTYVTSFNSNGFSLGNDNGMNKNNVTYASWNWKAGTSVSGNTTGSGTAKSYSGSVNTDAGFSIIKYTGNGTSGHTIPHNLTQKPAMIIVKNLTGDNWTVYHHKIASDPATDYIFLNSTAAASDHVGYWNDTEPTSSVFTVGNDGGTNANDVSLIAYCFAEKQGYSKFGSYVGNGSTDGPMVYTGFKPAWFMIKRTNANSYWTIFDNKRSSSGGSNEIDYSLDANVSNAEETGTSVNDVDFLSNGIKIREDNGDLNSSGSTIIYMAFAENPFVASNFVPTTAR